VTSEVEAFTFTAPLWRWSARQESTDPSSWVFLSLPLAVSEEVRVLAGEPRGFGSVRVHLEAGTSRWDTSVFPDATSACFVLPVKKPVRRAEGVEAGDELTVTVRVRDQA